MSDNTEKPQTKPLTVIIDPKVYAQLKTLAALEDTTMSGIVVDFLRNTVPDRLRAALAKATSDMEEAS